MAADQDPEYLNPAHGIIADTLAVAAGDPVGEWLDIAGEVLKKLAEAGWHLFDSEDAERLLASYVHQAIREGRFERGVGQVGRVDPLRHS